MAKAKNPRSSNLPNKQVITMPEVSSTPQVRKNTSQGSPTPIDIEAQIRARAYELYQERGCAPGLENDDWARAEREVRARLSHQQSA
jgi:hypothetical protein